MVKLGGSLLDLADVADRLTAVCSGLSAPVVVVGGGSAADRVRQWDRRQLVDSGEAHRLAIRAMSLNARRLARSDPRLTIADSRRGAAEAVAAGQLPLLNASYVLAVEQSRSPQLPCLPESWDVTSDSIAAWLARAWRGDLILLKSVSPRSDPQVHLDRWFGQASRGLSQLTWVNLRASEPEISRLSLPLTDTGR